MHTVILVALPPSPILNTPVTIGRYTYLPLTPLPVGTTTASSRGIIIVIIHLLPYEVAFHFSFSILAFCFPHFFLSFIFLLFFFLSTFYDMAGRFMSSTQQLLANNY